MGAKLFVGNLNPDTTKAGLADFLGPAGRLVSLTIPTERDTGRPRGFAFVEFAERSDAETAIASFDGSELDGHAVRLSWARERDEVGAESARKRRSFESYEDELDRPEPGGRRRERDRFDDEDARRSRRRRHHGKHGSDRKRGRGTRRLID